VVNEQRLSELLDTFLADSGCPGASLGVVVDGEVITAAAGVLNLNTGIAATPDSVFQIGSVTKLWTATLIMQLVDEGSVDLDAPVRTYLPDFSVAEEAVGTGVTVRHLLAHTSGIEGDVFDDVGTNDDCVTRYVDALASQGTVHELGETWSYCNSGFVVLGRIIEAVTQTLWDTAIKERLGAPLGMAQLGTTAGDAILHRASVGHVRHPQTEEIIVAPMWSLPRALGPAGLVNCSVADLLAFGRMHLDEGRAPDGSQVLAPGTVKLMREPQVPCPEPRLADAWGLGWMLKHLDGRLMAGHGGNTIGQSAYFQTVPDRGVAVALLTNLTGGAKQAEELLRTLLAELADVTLPPAPEPTPDLQIPLEPLVGEYARHGVKMSVDVHEDKLRMTVLSEGPIAAQLGMDEPIEVILEPYQQADDLVRFLTQMPHSDGAWTPVTFYNRDDEGRPRFLHAGARLSPRVS
jgi:CubicO group peptidase (beta-lactamase class C family)